MTEHYQICNNRCPEDYGQQVALGVIVEKLESKPDTTVDIEAGCRGICTKLGGVNNRPAAGICNFTLSVDGGPERDGVFGFNEAGNISKKFLDEQ